MKDSVECNLCKGSGENKSGLIMRVNNDICPRCGGYGKIPDTFGNSFTVSPLDRHYARNNGWVDKQE